MEKILFDGYILSFLLRSNLKWFVALKSKMLLLINNFVFTTFFKENFNFVSNPAKWLVLSSEFNFRKEKKCLQKQNHLGRKKPLYWSLYKTKNKLSSTENANLKSYLQLSRLQTQIWITLKTYIFFENWIIF